MDRYSTLREIARRQYSVPELYIPAEPYDFCVIGDSVTRDYHFCQKMLRGKLQLRVNMVN